MITQIRKSIKWALLMLRPAEVMADSNGHVEIESGKPLYLGKGARLLVAEGATYRIGTGEYISKGCIMKVMPNAILSRGNDVNMDECCRIVAAASSDVGVWARYPARTRRFVLTSTPPTLTASMPNSLLLRFQLGRGTESASTRLLRVASGLRIGVSSRRKPLLHGIARRWRRSTAACGRGAEEVSSDEASKE